MLRYAQTGDFDGGNTLGVGQKKEVQELVALRRNAGLVVNADRGETASSGNCCGTQAVLVGAGGVQRDYCFGCRAVVHVTTCAVSGAILSRCSCLYRLPPLRVVNTNRFVIRATREHGVGVRP